MAAFVPFEVNVKGSVGLTVTVAVSSSGASSSAILDSTNTYAPAILVTNGNAFTVFARISAEATPTATTADIALPANTIHLFANPVPNGKTGLAVTASVSTAPIQFCPGQGGTV